MFPVVTATLAENAFFRPEVPTAFSGSHPLSLNTTHIHDSLPSHLLRCSTWSWQQHRHDSGQGRHGAALRSLHLIPSWAGRTQEDSQTVGHYSGPQHLPANELFCDLSIPEDRHEESRLCLALQAHESGAATRYWLGTDSIYGNCPQHSLSATLPLFF